MKTFEEYIIKNRSVYFLHLVRQDMIKFINTPEATSLVKWLPNMYFEYIIEKECL